jgi:type IV pilus assembly protein PilC
MMEPRHYPFQWTGIDAQGQVKSGIIVSDSRLHALVTLDTQGLKVTRVQRQRRPLSLRYKEPVKSSDIMVFSRQIANLLQAGIPVADALSILEMCTEKNTMRELVATLKDDVTEGAALSEGLVRFPEQFDSLYVNLVAAGEQSGTLDLMLERLAIYQETRGDLNARVKKALTYPLTVLIIAVAVTAILLVKVVPQFAGTFADFGAELPAFTRQVLALADATAQYGVAALLILMVIAMMLSQLVKRSEKRMTALDRLLLTLPILGRLLRDASLARFCSTLATTLKAGIPAMEAILAAGGASGNRVYQLACITIAHQVGDGLRLTNAIRATGLFPVMIVQLIHVGEESGTLESMLEKCATSLEQSVNTLVDSLTSLIEPLIMSVLGVIIGSLMLAMYLPVFRLGAVL